MALVAVLLLRSRLISAPKEALLRLRSAASQRRLSPEEFAQALQQVYISEADGSKTILVPHRNSISKVGLWSPCSRDDIVVIWFCGPFFEAIEPVLGTLLPDDHVAQAQAAYILNSISSGMHICSVLHVVIVLSERMGHCATL